MSHRLAFLICALALLLVAGCRKRNRDATAQGPDGAAAAAGRAPAPPAPPQDVPPETALHFLNDGVRNFYAEKLKMPASLEEVYAAGYVKERFNPPPGRQFVINPQSRAVEIR